MSNEKDISWPTGGLVASDPAPSFKDDREWAGLPKGDIDLQAGGAAHVTADNAQGKRIASLETRLTECCSRIAKLEAENNEYNRALSFICSEVCGGEHGWEQIGAMNFARGVVASWRKLKTRSNRFLRGLKAANRRH